MRRACMLFVLWLWLFSSQTSIAAPSQPIDAELKTELILALADQSSHSDRFDMEVWVTDISTRLQNYIDDPDERLVLLRTVYQESLRANLAPELVLAVIEVESHFDRFAISRAGARGLMQIMPFWLDEIGSRSDNLFHITTNLRFGCTILRHYLDKDRGDLSKALARYNGSRGSMHYPNKVYSALKLRWRE